MSARWVRVRAYRQHRETIVASREVFSMLAQGYRFEKAWKLVMRRRGWYLLSKPSMAVYVRTRPRGDALERAAQ